VVLQADKRPFGLIVHRILDIVEQEISLEHPWRDSAIRSSGVVQNKVRDLLDVDDLLNGRNHSFEEDLLPSGRRS